jgi:DNA-binding GntR family transcriptional regulator
MQRMRNVERYTFAWVERHDSFHNSLCAVSRRPQLVAECRRYRLAVSPYVRLFVSSHDYAEQPGYEHDILLAVLRDGDPDAADELMRRHIMANAEAIASNLPESPRRSAS